VLLLVLKSIALLVAEFSEILEPIVVTGNESSATEQLGMLGQAVRFSKCHGIRDSLTRRDALWWRKKRSAPILHDDDGRGEWLMSIAETHRQRVLDDVERVGLSAASWLGDVLLLLIVNGGLPAIGGNLHTRRLFNSDLLAVVGARGVYLLGHGDL
jgi:hypothetical protein